MKFYIEEVSESFCEDVVASGNDSFKYKPLGLFLAKSQNGDFIAIDNSSGNAWTEDFKCKEDAEKWLKREFEVDSWDRSEKSERENILDEVIEALAFSDGVGSWKDAVAVIEKMKNGFK